MSSISLNANYTHHCFASPGQTEQPSILTTIANLYNRIIRDLSAWLFSKALDHQCEGFVGKFFLYSHLTVGSLLSEPLTTLSSAASRLTCNWQSTWEKHGFYDAGDAKSLQSLEEKLKHERPDQVHLPVLFFHALYDTPHSWLNWAPELEESEHKNQIGHVITLQLPNDLDSMLIKAHEAINAVTAIYKRVLKKDDVQVNLVGHSRGGYAAHLAAFSEVNLVDNDIERRWHKAEARNPLVHKVIAIAAPTWLCCQGQKDGDHKEIYPRNDNFTQEQKETIRATHHNIFDIVGTMDAISLEKSGLPAGQVFPVKHKHQGLVHCLDVCKLAVTILSPQVE